MPKLSVSRVLFNAACMLCVTGCSSAEEVSGPAVYAGDAGVGTPIALTREDVRGATRRAAQIAEGYSLLEGPAWDPCEDRLLFTDVNTERILQLRGDREITTFRERSNFANALTFDRTGGLLAAEMAGGRGGRITRTDRAGHVELLVDRTPEGGPLNTVDDLALRADGTIYFSDPTIPHGDYLGFPLGAERLYSLTGGIPRYVAVEDDVWMPNGVDLSPDEHTLYVNGYLLGEIVRYRVDDDGRLRDRRLFASGLNAPDSSCLDVAGNLYVGTRDGLFVATADGRPLGTIQLLTTQGVTNCTFGGQDGKTLYVTAWDTLWRISDMPVAGLDWSRTRDSVCN